MHDWQQLVRTKLAGLALEREDAARVTEELAAHLEDNYQSLLRAGLSEQESARRALTSVDGWQELKRKIESSRKKELPMPKRVAQFWFPAFVTLSLSMVLLAVLEIFGPKPWVTPMPGGPWLRMAPLAVVYGSWLFSCRLSAHWGRTYPVDLAVDRALFSLRLFSLFSRTSPFSRLAFLWR